MVAVNREEPAVVCELEKSMGKKKYWARDIKILSLCRV